MVALTRFVAGFCLCGMLTGIAKAEPYKVPARIQDPNLVQEQAISLLTARYDLGKLADKIECSERDLEHFETGQNGGPATNRRIRNCHKTIEQYEKAGLKLRDVFRLAGGIQYSPGFKVLKIGPWRLWALKYWFRDEDPKTAMILPVSSEPALEDLGSGWYRVIDSNTIKNGRQDGENTLRVTDFNFEKRVQKVYGVDYGECGDRNGDGVSDLTFKEEICLNFPDCRWWRECWCWESGRWRECTKETLLGPRGSWLVEEAGRLKFLRAQCHGPANQDSNICRSMEAQVQWMKIISARTGAKFEAADVALADKAAKGFSH